MSRYFIDNSYYFITVPTTDRFAFFDTDKKKSLILTRLNKVREYFKLNNLDFGIISTHYHFITYFPTGRIIPRILQLINGGSAYDLNKMTGNKKPIWDEYHIYLIENEVILDKVRGYVVGNPLKHGEVKTLQELEKYPFSSYNSLIKRLGRETARQLIESVIIIEEDEFVNNLTKVSKKKSKIYEIQH